MTVQPTISVESASRRKPVAIAVVLLVAAVALFSAAVSRSAFGAAHPPTRTIVRSPADSAALTLTPDQLARLGRAYAVPSTQTHPTTSEILRSMSPQTRASTKALLRLTFAQLSAGAAGSP